jgi:hypothetical protein
MNSLWQPGVAMRIVRGPVRATKDIGPHWLTALVAVAVAATCVAAVGHFLHTIFYNRLPFPGEHVVRDHYLAVGNSYSQGFVVGFFLCLSLAMLAVSLAGLREARLRAAAEQRDYGRDSLAESTSTSTSSPTWPRKLGIEKRSTPSIGRS